MLKTLTACFAIALELANGLALRGDLPQRRLEVAEYMEAMAGPPPPFCFIENGFDYVGEDIKNLPGPTAESCCSKCSPAEGCNAYSWTNFNGGTCWLKRSRGKIIVNANVKSALFFFNPRETCGIKNDVDFIGNDIGNAASATADACCGLCRSLLGCRAFSWSNHNGGTCWFKSSRGQAQTKTGVKSADVFPTLDSNPVCAQEFNLDYVGFDIGNVPSPLAAGCCSICAATPPCRAFSWSNFNGGTCWLKSYKGEAVVKQGVVSAQITENPPAFCDFEEGTDYVGNDIGSVPSKDSSLCCPLCRDHEGCKAVTWSDYNGGTCWLKSAKGDTAAKAGVKSATLPGMAL